MIKKLSIALFLFAGISLFAQNDMRNWSTNQQSSKSFIENKGQFPKVNNANVEFAIDDNGTKIYFSSTGITYSFFQNEIKSKKEIERELLSGKSESEREREEHESSVKTDKVNITWENANPSTKIIAAEKSETYFSYAIKTGTEVTNINNINGYKKITYKDLYPNIDVIYTFHPAEGIKYAVILHPGADASQVKMKYSDATKISVSADNNLYIKTIFGNIIDHAPVTFYANDKSSLISSKFIKSGNSISFQLGAYDKNRTVIIDPWTQTPALSNSNGVWECEKDAAGNVYIIGGDMPMKLLKYAPTGGAPIWTYVTPWDTSNSWLGTFVTDLSGNSYVTAGSTAELEKINTSAGMTYHVTGGGLDEYWNIAFNCDQTKLIIGGTRLVGFPTPVGDGMIFEINTVTGNVISTKKVGTCRPGFLGINDIEEVRAITSSYNARYYYMTLDTLGTFDQNFASCASSNNGILFERNHAYAFGYKCEDWRPKGNSGIMAMRANKNFLYTQNGTTVDKRSLMNGAILFSAAIPGGVSTSSLGKNQVGNSGLDIDSCGNVYVGSTNGVIKYDANLSLLSNTAVGFHVYDVSVSYGGNVIVCGATGVSTTVSRTGTVQSLNLSSCDPSVLACCDANFCSVGGPYCTTDPSFTLSPVTAGGTWSGPGVNASGVFNPATAGSGTHTVVYTLPCGSTSTNIVVNACATLNVCISGSTLSVTGGTPAYTWQTQTTSANCSACIIGCTFPANCSVTVTSWTTVATGTSTFTPGSYPVHVFDNAGNSYTITTSGSVPTCSVSCAAPTVSVQSTTSVTCFNGNNGAGTVIAAPSGTYTYTWMNGSLNGASQAGLSAGVYTVTAVNGACSGTVAVTIAQPSAALSASASVTQGITCAGTTTGAASVTISGGTPNYSVIWSNSATGTSISNVGAGVYTYTVTDINSCVTTGSVSLPNPPDILVSANITQTSCIASTGAATINVNGGTPGYTYSWSSGQTTNIVTNLGVGVYTITVTDANNCVASITLNMTCSTGIDQYSALADLMIIYPNPANEMLHVDLLGKLQTTNYEVRILDLLGKEIKSKKSDTNGGSMQLEITDLSVGVYIVSIKTDDVVITKKFIIQR